ncbi:MAG: hypothetical protein S4CHLAM102_07710 [Chlamydiia bacterium]|nr:hypothetical protein [Chlamydiia bacterium]
MLQTVVGLGTGITACAAGAMGGMYALGGYIDVYCAKNALNAKLPKETGESVYGTIMCTAESDKVYEALKDHPVMLGRVRVKEDHFSMTSSRKHTIPFPETIHLKSAFGPVVAHRLHWAEWNGHLETTEYKKPIEAELELTRLGLGVNQDAPQYIIKNEGFKPGTSLTIFGKIVKREEGFEVHPPERANPFIVTTEDKDAYIRSEKRESQNDIMLSIAAITLGVAAGVWGLSAK